MKKTTANFRKTDRYFYSELLKRDRYAAELFGNTDHETVVFDNYYDEWQIVDRNGRILFATNNMYDIIDMYVDMANDENVIY